MLLLLSLQTSGFSCWQKFERIPVFFTRFLKCMANTDCGGEFSLLLNLFLIFISFCLVLSEGWRESHETVWWPELTGTWRGPQTKIVRHWNFDSNWTVSSFFLLFNRSTFCTHLKKGTDVLGSVVGPLRDKIEQIWRNRKKCRLCFEIDSFFFY